MTLKDLIKPENEAKYWAEHARRNAEMRAYAESKIKRLRGVQA